MITGNTKQIYTDRIESFACNYPLIRYIGLLILSAISLFIVETGRCTEGIKYQDPLQEVLVELNIISLSTRHADSNRFYNDSYNTLLSAMHDNPESEYFERALVRLGVYASSAGLYKEAADVYDNIYSRDMLVRFQQHAYGIERNAAHAYLATGRYNEALAIWDRQWAKLRNGQISEEGEVFPIVYTASRWILSAEKTNHYTIYHLRPLLDMIQDRSMMNETPQRIRGMLLSGVESSYHILCRLIWEQEYIYGFPGNIKSKNQLEHALTIRETREPELIELAVLLSRFDIEDNELEYSHTYIPLQAENIYHLLTAENPKDYVEKMASILRIVWDNIELEKTGKILEGTRLTTQLAEIGMLSTEEISDLVLRMDRTRERLQRQRADEQTYKEVNKHLFREFLPRIENALRRDRNRIQSTLDILEATRETP